ncbi:MAG: hypothetical protein K0R20_9 [Actinomycetia bacterium]|jgi:serine phosphatase RsbU (regulator of sigma subunit)|nr:hypothetical protein [Actinomycetes bacterium]
MKPYPCRASRRKAALDDIERTVALGDVVGKGPDAAALMGMVRHTIRAAAIRERAPARVLRHRERGRRQADDRGTTASEIVSRIERAVLAHGSGEPRDDIAILAVRATG